jgi:CheY-like chemotaxis protein
MAMSGICHVIFLYLSMPSNKPYVLFADDDVEDQEYIKEIFASHLDMVDLVTVDDGPAVIALLQSCPNDHLPLMILLDFKMPKMTAAATLQFLSTERRYLTIPKVVWSTSNNPEHVHDCLQWGATHYFLKPSTMNESSHIASRIIETVKFQLSMLP